MKKRHNTLILLSSIFIILIAAQISSAAFQLGNRSYNIVKVYGDRTPLSGWINISLDSEPADSLLKDNFGNSITIKELLDMNNADYDCFPFDCSSNYVAGEEKTGQIIRISKGQTVYLGFKIPNGEDVTISALNFNITSTATQTSCSEPLYIDILDDGMIETNIEFQASDDFSCVYGSGGCFDVENANNEERVMIGETEYCQEISIPNNVPNLILKAYIDKGSTIAELYAELYNSDFDKKGECKLEQETASIWSCLLNAQINKGKYFVCVYANKETDYGLWVETKEPLCGFFGKPTQWEGDYTADYGLYAVGPKYRKETSSRIEISENKNGVILDEINSYLADRYGNNCENSCLIPLAITSTTDLDLTVSDISLNYLTKTGARVKENIFMAKKEPALLSSEFIKLKLDKANFTISGEYGEYMLKLTLGGSKLLQTEISIEPVPEIHDLYPKIFDAGIPVTFIVNITSEKPIVKILWDFGDNSTAETNTTEVVHTYSGFGSYTVTVTAIDSEGREGSKSFIVVSGEPRLAINLTLQLNKQALDSLEQDIAKLGWFKSYAEKILGIEDMKLQLESIENKFNEYVTHGAEEEEWLELASQLISLNIPVSFAPTIVAKAPLHAIITWEQIDPSLLAELGAGTINEGASMESYKKAIVNWLTKLAEEKEISIEEKVYSALYLDGTHEEKLTFLKIELPPIQAQELYMVIDADPEKIKLKNNELRTKEANGKFAIIFGEKELENRQTIELIIENKADIYSGLIYLSPEFGMLEETLVIEPCNYNGVCESGENWRNCRHDCKPAKIAVFLLFILFAAAFAAYIAIQEWYKKYYVKRLFKDRNEYYNLITFVYRMLSQGKTEKEIKRILKQYKWKSEQIDYALKKARGERSMAWEIPVFAKRDKAVMQREIRKRLVSGSTPSYNPKRI